MPQKRKVEAASTEERPAKRATTNTSHSSPLNSSVINSSTPKTKVVRTYGRNSKRIMPTVVASVKENPSSPVNCKVADTHPQDEPDDELLLSPHKPSNKRPTPSRKPVVLITSRRSVRHTKELNKHIISPNSDVVGESTPESEKRHRTTNVGITRKQKPISIIEANVDSQTKQLTQEEQAITAEVTKLPNKFLERTTPTLSEKMFVCLAVQRGAILRALRQNKDIYDNLNKTSEDQDATPTNVIAEQQFIELLRGTITRGEGNSCLILGPRNSGKSLLAEKYLSKYSDEIIPIRLSGYVQSNDRLAMREIARQINQYGDNSFQPDEFCIENVDEDINPFLETTQTNPSPSVSLPSAHLPSLISVLTTLSRPVIVVLDAFELFALHPRQSLLYSLFDTVQSCRAGPSNKGLAVVGLTARIDTIQLLEKRVKSRFSGRTIRTGPPNGLRDYLEMTRAILSTKSSIGIRSVDDEWRNTWEASVDELLRDPAVKQCLNETFSVSKDFRILSRILTTLLLRLSPTSPFLTANQLVSAAATQLKRPNFPFVSDLPYPSLCLLIASVHAMKEGHMTFTFEFLHEKFCTQVRASTAAPIQVKSGKIGMVRCTRDVLMSAFEKLIHTRIFISVSPPSTNTTKEFIKYRSALEIGDVKKAVEKASQVNLTKWLTKV